MVQSAPIGRVVAVSAAQVIILLEITSRACAAPG